MRTARILRRLAIACIAFMTLAQCRLIPSLQHRSVEITVGGSTSVVFVAQGGANYLIDDTTSVAIKREINILQMIENAGMHISDVKDLKLAGVSYRVRKKDSSIDRQIRSGRVAIGRGDGPVIQPNTPLVTDFLEGVNFVTTFTPAPLDPAGVALINGLLADLLTEARNPSVPATNTVLMYRLTGGSYPTDEDTDFTWELRVNVTVVGTVNVDVVE